ncbi:hypothetical protein [Tenacibaculum sp. M341]|uniref:hypothetical protein n=1 Tax=Tenacibaculum sp. M341 TaxID=2530339 RepID=UPI0010435704|nr:hypothetical protein [Tenacibaculum sp. M341]TCI90662.1 hypothetical protein EYW44_13140 [Tenacibaculum sp. M341]
MKIKHTELITFLMLTILLVLASCIDNEYLDTEITGSGVVITTQSTVKPERNARNVREWNIDVRMRNLRLGFKEAFNSILNDRNFTAGDVIKLGEGPYNIDGKFEINKAVTIIGNRKHGTSIYQRTGSKSNPDASLFIVCSTTNIKFKNLTINAGNNSSKAVHINKEFVEFHGVKFIDAKWAIFSNRNFGGLKIIDCHFTKSITFRGIEFNRVWSKDNVSSMR